MLFTNNFRQIWQIAARNKAEQYVLNYPLHLARVHTLPCNVTRDRNVTKYYSFT